MQLKFNIAQHGHLGPKAWTYLCALQDEHCFHDDHNKRHPRSIYKKKLQIISKQFTVILNSLETVRDHYRYDKGSLSVAYNKLLSDYRELLYRLNEHHDDCLSILRSLCPPDRAAPEIFDSRYLRNAKLPGAYSFLQATKEYRDEHIALIVNNMKHSQGELSQIYMHASKADKSIDFRPGYFLSDVLPGGILGPNAKLHSDGKTAFSFSRDLRVHAWWLYKMGDLLATAIGSAIHGIHKTKLLLTPCELDAPDLLVMLRGCSALPLQFFPDETKKPYPTIHLSGDNTKLTMEFSKKIRGGFPAEMQFNTAMTIDKEHMSNKLPYFGSEYAKWESGIQ